MTRMRTNPSTMVSEAMSLEVRRENSGVRMIGGNERERHMCYSR